MLTDALRALDFDRHMAFVTEVSRAALFDDLSVWVRDVILAGERQFAEVQAQRMSASEPSPVDRDVPRRQP